MGFNYFHRTGNICIFQQERMTTLCFQLIVLFSINRCGLLYNFVFIHVAVYINIDFMLIDGIFHNEVKPEIISHGSIC